MSRRNSSSTPAKHPTAPWRPWLLGSLVALIVSRPLLPSEAVAWRGDGLIWPLATLLLLGAALTGSAMAGKGAAFAPRGWKRIDLLALAYLLCVAVSAGWAIRTASPRPAVHMLCEQAGLVALYLVARQCFARPIEIRAVVLVMFGLSVALSCYGLYQYFVSLPATRAHYQADPDAALREIGQWFPPNSRERYSFEQRLASIEPMATFALTNSLAGFLVPWLVAGIGLLLAGAGVVSRGRRAILAALVTACCACLLLTKSRSGYVGAALGAGLAVLALPTMQRLRSSRSLSLGAGVLTALVAALAWHGGLDRLVLSEAPKSLGYRWEYWQAALSMTGDYPLLGCGPGNFGDTYTRYKLPASSEEISDPHNFLLEIAASTGWPAAALYVAFLIAAFWPAPAASSACQASDEPTAAFPWAIPLGGVAGFLAALLLAPLVGISPEPSHALGGAAIVALVAYLGQDWVRTPGHVNLAAPLAALLVNLLAAGGFGFPGVAGSLWLLAALVVNQRSAEIEIGVAGSPGQTKIETTRVANALGAAAALLAAGAAIVFAYRPAVACQSLVLQADHHVSSAGSRLLAATEADPWSDEAWRRLAAVRYAHWLQSHEAADFADFERAAQRTVELRPRSSGVRVEIADRYLDAFHRQQEAAMLDKAIEFYRDAIRLYPHSAHRQARLAVALRDAGQKDRAAAAATEALRLSDLSPHVEHQLWNEARSEVEAIAAGGP